MDTVSAVVQENQVEATRLINAFAIQLLSLTNNKPVPRTWKNQLSKALQPALKASGVQLDIELHAKIIRDLIRLDASKRPMRDASVIYPDDTQIEIAERHNVNPKTVYRAKIVLSDFIDGKDLDENRKKAVIEGFSLALCVAINESDRQRNE